MNDLIDDLNSIKPATRLWADGFVTFFPRIFSVVPDIKKASVSRSLLFNVLQLSFHCEMGFKFTCHAAVLVFVIHHEPVIGGRHQLTVVGSIPTVATWFDHCK